MTPHLLTMTGSLRKHSFNRKLAAEAARLYGADEVVEASLHLPLYNGDLEDELGIPAPVQLLADQISAAEAVVIATPEYNKSLPGVLKNALDWVSRTRGRPFRDKPVAIVSASDGRHGGDRAQFALRLALVSFRPRLLSGPEVMLAFAQDHFDADGRLTDDRLARQLAELMAALRTEAGRGA
jgi:chromate reductase